MEPLRQSEVTLTDVIDRLLDKGLVLNAELVITLGEIPLVGINLKAMIAGMETMIQYGLMEGYDTQASSPECKEKESPQPLKVKKVEAVS